MLVLNMLVCYNGIEREGTHRVIALFYTVEVNMFNNLK
jgi:hypothetical protein